MHIVVVGITEFFVAGFDLSQKVFEKETGHLKLVDKTVTVEKVEREIAQSLIG